MSKVNVKDYGALGDGSTEDTAAIQSAMHSGQGNIYFPKGNYVFSHITVPNTVHTISGDGISSTVFTCTGIMPNFQSWIVLSAITGIEISGFSVTQNKVAYALNPTFNVDSCFQAHLHDIRWEQAGWYAVYMAGCTDVLIENNVVIFHADGAFRSEAGSVRTRILGNTILSSGAGHGIQVATGTNHEITNNYVFRAGPGCFGIAIGGSDSIVSNNRVMTNSREGINVQDASRVSITDNIVFCEGGHHDFGISIYAANAPVEACVVSGNRTYNSGSSGIGIASTNFANAYCRYNRISDNHIMNPVQAGAAISPEARAGLLLYGPQTSANVLQANTVIDQAANMRYGVAEWDDGLGAPSYNSLIHNHAPIGAGLVAQSRRLAATTKVWDLP